MKHFSFLFIFIVSGISCEQLAEEETPVCKVCYQVVYNKATNQPIDTVYIQTNNSKLCGGDIPNWQTLTDIVGDTTITKHKCE